MKIGNILNSDFKNKDSKLRQMLILGALAVILIGFGNRYVGGFETYDDYNYRPDQFNGNDNYGPLIPNKEKKHKHHRHKKNSLKTYPNTASVECENTEKQDYINPSEAQYTIE